jgi:transketolase
MEAGHYKLDSLIGIIDCFGWDVMRIDGHNLDHLVDALEQAKAVTGRPVVVLADTMKGKDVSFMEDQAGWHGKTPNHEELNKALSGTETEGRIAVQLLLDNANKYQVAVEQVLDAKMPKFSRNYVECR